MEDFRDGTVLCSLVEALQGRKLKGWSQKPTNQHHKLENVTNALQAIENDGVKLVNIGMTITIILYLISNRIKRKIRNLK